jgi:CO dehydrogenase maturation factor
VYRQWRDYAAGFDVALAVAGNKVQSELDVAFLREHAGGDLLTWFGYEPAVRAMEQGRPFGLGDLSAGTRAGLAALQAAVDAQVKDWPKYTGQAVEFHLRNARAWANAATGDDLAAQVDPGFVLGPESVAAARP